MPQADHINYGLQPSQPHVNPLVGAPFREAHLASKLQEKILCEQFIYRHNAVITIHYWGGGFTGLCQDEEDDIQL